MNSVAGATRTDPSAHLAEGLAQLGARWRHARRHFDARAESERRLVVIAVLAVAVFALDAWWLTPSYRALRLAYTRQHSAQTRLTQLLDEQRRMAGERQAMGQQMHHELEQLRQGVRQGEVELDEAQGALVPARGMRQLLQDMLAEHGHLKLISMQTLPREELRLPELASASGSHSSTNGGTSATTGGALMYRHGLELTVEGDFHDLLAWVRSLERMPRKLLWDSLQLRSDAQYRLALTLRVYTLSRDAEPLEIGS